MAKQRTTKFDIFESSVKDNISAGSSNIQAKTLQDMFELEKSNNEELAKLKAKAEKDAVKEQAAELKKRYLSVTEEVAQARMNGVRDIASYEAKLQKQLLEDVQKQRLESQNKLYADELKKIQSKMKSGKARQADNQSKYNDNYAMLKMYKQIGDENLTDEQKRDKEARESEQKSIEQENKSLKMQETLCKTMQNLADSVKGAMDKYTSLQAHTNARLQGRSGSTNQSFELLSDKITTAIGVNPYFSTETALTNLSELVNEGIVTNVEQRAFIQTAKENIANTFDVANSSLLRIVRLQQSDSTAQRLGMEAYLTRYLNGLVDNTEYLNSTFDSVTDALIEAQSQMSTEAGTELEYVVQKWLGALVGVGMNDSTATSIAQALGYLGSGNIDALNNSELQNLLVMAASKSGTLSYSDILTNGLSATDADTLMDALVKYLAEVNTSGSNVVKSQLASTFGVSYSDLQAASTLSADASKVYGNTLSYSDMYNELAYQLTMTPLRLTTSQMLDTLWDNLEFGLGETIASSPALAAIYKVTDLIQQNTGGINIPYISAMGSGIDLNTSVENLIKLGVVGAGSLGMIGDLISGMSSTLAPASILAKLGISNNATTISRGSGLSASTGGLSTSQSSVTAVSNSSGSDIKESALASATDEVAESNAAADPEQEQKERAPLSIYEWLSDDYNKMFGDLLDQVRSIQDDVSTIGAKFSMGG